MKLYGIKTRHNSHIHMYIADSIEHLIKPFSYSLSYDSEHKSIRSVKTMVNILSNTGSYWSNTNTYEAMSKEDIKKIMVKHGIESIDNYITIDE